MVTWVQGWLWGLLLLASLARPGPWCRLELRPLGGRGAGHRPSDIPGVVRVNHMFTQHVLFGIVSVVMVMPPERAWKCAIMRMQWMISDIEKPTDRSSWKRKK